MVLNLKGVTHPCKELRRHPTHWLDHSQLLLFCSAGFHLYMEVSQFLLLLLCFCHATSALSDSSHVYLQRGRPGEIPNPHVTDDFMNITSVYWYKLTPEGKLLLISNYEGSITFYKRYMYNMTENGGLIVNNVTDTDGGRYISQVVKSQQILPDSSVDVTIFVSPSEHSPWIEECGLPKDINDYCTMQLPSEETEYHVTCHVTGARPALDLYLQQVLADGSTEAVGQVLLRVQREDSLQDGVIDRDKALFTSTLYFNGTFHGNTTFLCVATGLAMGRNNGSAMQVRIWKLPDDTHVTSTAKLITDVEKEGKGRFVWEGFGIVALSVVVILIFAFVMKNFCRKESIRQAIPAELRPFLSKGCTTEDEIAKLLKVSLLKTTDTIPTHPSDFSVSLKTKDIFVLPVLSKVTNKSTVSEMVNINQQDSTHVYLDIPDKEPLQSLDDLIQILIDNQHVVVVGHPGCGKNSIITKLGHDFATGNWKYFKYVFILRKEDIHNGTGVLDAMHRLLPAESKISKQGFQHVISKHGKQVLIILGFAFLLEALSADASRSANNDDTSFQDLLSFKGLISCSILVTACPHQLHQLQSYYSNYTVVEATGFSEECSEEYIQKFFSDDDTKAGELHKALQSDSDLANLAQSPLTLQVLCRIWKTRNKLPEQITELYDKVLDAKVNNLKTKYGIAKPQMDSLKTNLGQVAYDGLIDPRGDRRVFSPEEFPSITLEQGLKLGMLSQVTRTSEEGTVHIVEYPHLYQDYFAAHYVVTDPATRISPVLRNGHEHLLRFCREKSEEAALMIDDHYQQT